ncbi:MAG: LPS export ABC transporter periplasmic protein LptC [Marinobacter sp.]|uniref:LPS export ABC transporter periplasmic protein LptC n=1 Tax=Marinobacter sp. TaxID=50741 RepID=UPI00299ECB2F|nr:LPS export ABC transporter periplasmic protein LptC [Marinobacter sp.]MDX1756724.1 LPS export ABC transporter periplasmic protein LptC [Marinobacter sp.]
MTLADALSRPWVRTLALLVSVLVLVALLWQSDERIPAPDAESLRGPSEPDGFVINGHYRAFNEQGHLTTMISSPRIEQFDADHTAIMNEPNATLIDRKSGAAWHLTAKRGTFRENADRIRLSGEVLVTRPIADGRDATLETDSLVLDNRQRTVHTDDRVTMTDGRNTTRATGMTAWIDDRIVEFKSQVEGQYEPAQPQAR